MLHIATLICHAQYAKSKRKSLGAARNRGRHCGFPFRFCERQHNHLKLLLTNLHNQTRSGACITAKPAAAPVINLLQGAEPVAQCNFKSRDATSDGLRQEDKDLSTQRRREICFCVFSPSRGIRVRPVTLQILIWDRLPQWPAWPC